MNSLKAAKYKSYRTFQSDVIASNKHEIRIKLHFEHYYSDIEILFILISKNLMIWNVS